MGDTIEKEKKPTVQIPDSVLSDDYALLKELTEIASCSGFETSITNYIQKLLQNTCDSFEIDAMGTLYATIKGNPGNRTVMIDAHADEIGFQVVYIESSGFLRVEEIGGQNPRILPGSRVIIHSARGGPLIGIIGEKPIHLLTQEQRKKTSDLTDLFVDLGLASKEEVEKYVDVGDFVTFAQKTERFSNSTLATGKSFDDRAGCWALIRMLQKVKANGPTAVNIIGVFASQEEIGVRGATTAAFKTDPDYALVLEVNHALDFPGAPKAERGDVSIGKGPIIPIGPNVHPKMSQKIIQTAKNAKIPIQTVALPRPASNDARTIQISRNGIMTGLITIPLRYMHTTVETLDLKDLHQTAELLYEVVKILD